jgi:hypothetical protein
VNVELFEEVPITAPTFSHLLSIDWDNMSDAYGLMHDMWAKVIKTLETRWSLYMFDTYVAKGDNNGQ